jgi:anti-sigma B factor antagonist
MLKIEFGPEGTVVIEGRLDAAQAAAAQTFLDAVSGSVTLDCSALEYISSAGLGVLLKTQKRLKPSGGGLRLTHLSRHVHDVFRYAGFDQIFEIAAAP